MKYKKINGLIYKFENLGIENSSDGAILIGKAPHIAPEAWLNEIFPVLDSKEIKILEEQLKTDIPEDYKNFLMNFSNGLIFLSSTLSLYGLRRQLNRRSSVDSRQPYSIITSNIPERPDNAKNSFFFIGGYNWDGSRLYIDKNTNKVHCCERWDATSRIEWNSFQEMLLTELKRLYSYFDDEGKEIDEDRSTLPY
ncbi:SMI1 / KNR4 family (SUKH-1) [Chryseobacterium wanjuense]|uniref:SMI1 / KNR4 family (SUKH-1) n=1 Tax=Chryseobacterium wanjuense TaxID=356305 RepID=A0A1I0QE64_9FLAO|nr:SMI1/KNR4 family protein [Chryseobacterium wanjuense]SEW25279.1 SMI1 / KNR4 family (SUKH-1) [Chryseobacterium wanjuense]